MKRLLEMPDARDPLDRRLAELFASVPRGAADPIRKRRIYARLLASKSRNAGRWSSVGMRWAIIGASLVGVTAAAAMVGHQVRRLQSSSVAVEQAPPTEGSPRKSAPSGIGSDERVVTSTSSSHIDSAPPAPNAESRPPTRPSASASEDPSLVAAAIQALRNQHDPAKARVLLGQYLREHPRGALAEEALALSIEAAAAMKDPSAAKLGCRYLSAYPNGRNRALASRVCGKSLAEK